MDDKDNFPMIVGVVVAILAGAFIYADRHHSTTSPASKPIVATPETTAPPASSDQLVLPSFVIQQPSQTRTVYECVNDGKRVFSDAPCGDRAKIRTLSQINVMDARQPIYQSDPNLNEASRRDAVRDSSDTPPVRDCTIYEEEVKRIDARMRQSYTSSEGEYLRAHRHQAAEIRDDCKRDNRLR